MDAKYGRSKRILQMALEADPEQNSMSDCKEKWKNVRLAFIRSLKAVPSGSSAKAKKPYYLHDHLQFIVPYVKPTNTIENAGAPRGTSKSRSSRDELEEVETLTTPTRKEQCPEPASQFEVNSTKEKIK